ncbi:MAG TPA: hypothetical protein VJB16_01505, partial [archaeon]|nr:hypothetical protein [archaeon]
ERTGMRIGVSPLIATVLVIALVIALAGLIIPWTYQFAQSTTNRTQGQAEQDIICQGAAFELDTSYGNNGLLWNFTGTSDTLSARVTNTGQVNLFNFTFQVTFNETSAIAIRSFEGNSTSNVLKSNPLKPGRSAIVHASIGSDQTGTPVLVKLVNEACPRVFREQSL